MNVLHVISSAGLYGAERVLMNLVTSVPNLRMQTALFAKSDGGHQPLATALEQAEIPVHYLPDGLGQLPRAVTALRDIVQRLDCHVVHSHGYKANVLSVLACGNLSGCRLVCSEHGFPDDSLKAKVYGAVDRFAMRSAVVHSVLCVSDSVISRCAAVGVDRSKLIKVKNGIKHSDTDQMISYSNRDIDLLFLGRLSPEKGPTVLLNALAQLDRLPRTVIAGAGPQEDELKHQAEALGLSADIEFVGFCDVPEALVQRAKWLVMPSLTEGLPMSLLEALAHGTPVIASDVGEIGALHQRRNWGVLVTPPDNADVLAQALQQALAVSEHDWATYQEAGRALIQSDFQFQQWVDSWLAIYHQAAESIDAGDLIEQGAKC